ncbi:MAG: Hsp20/alpha crystallin family protein [Bacilli bacterium]|jgi:HSP20 family molecular chaperone IbpA|nr:Hsp20/alpha crystallin family protein [Bacilli bacterium]
MNNDIAERGNFFLDLFPEGFMGPAIYDHYAKGLEMKTDITDDGKNYVMEVELPGIDKKDINVTLKDEYLTIKANVNASKSEKGEKGSFIHRERYSGTATRSYYVGEVDTKSVKAAYANGVLTLTIPKEAEKKAEDAHLIAIE